MTVSSNIDAVAWLLLTVIAFSLSKSLAGLGKDDAMAVFLYFLAAPTPPAWTLLFISNERAFVRYQERFIRYQRHLFEMNRSP